MTENFIYQYLSDIPQERIPAVIQKLVFLGFESYSRSSGKKNVDLRMLDLAYGNTTCFQFQNLITF